jgi:hypothetical protein
MVFAIAIGGVLAANSGAVADSVSSPAIEFNGAISNTCALSQSFSDASINLTCNGDTQVAVTNFQDLTQSPGIALNKNNKLNVKNIQPINPIFHSIMLLSGPVNQNITVDVKALNSNVVKPIQYNNITKLTVTVQ